MIETIKPARYTAQQRKTTKHLILVLFSYWDFVNPVETVVSSVLFNLPINGNLFLGNYSLFSGNSCGNGRRT